MSTRNDNDSGGSLILVIVFFFLIINQCSVDERLDKIEFNMPHNSVVSQ